MTDEQDIIRQIEAIELTIHPELLAASVQKKVLDLYVIWMIIKAIDAKTGGRGLTKFDKLMTIVCGALGYHKGYAYQKINNGIGVFWSKPSGIKGERQIALASKNKVCDWLEPDMVQSQAFLRTIGDFLPVMTGDTECVERGPAKIKRLAFEMIAARHTNNRPVSYESLAHSTGVSKRTAIRRIKESFYAESQFEKTSNFAKLFVTSYPEEAIQMFQELKKTAPSGSMPFRFAKQSGKYIIVQQQGNTYTLSNQVRLPLHKRPDTLKLRDATNGCKTAMRLYCTSSKHIVLSTTSPSYYKPAGFGHVYNIGRVTLWQPVGKIVLPKIITADEQLKNEHIRPWIKTYLASTKK